MREESREGEELRWLVRWRGGIAAAEVSVEGLAAGGRLGVLQRDGLDLGGERLQRAAARRSFSWIRVDLRVVLSLYSAGWGDPSMAKV